MKTWVSFLVFSLMIISGSVLAQDAGMSDVEIVGDKDASDERASAFSPGDMDAHYIPRASGVYAPSDSIALHIHDFPMQAAQKPVDRTNEKQPSKSKDESILTFNFLYYIIQKYKLQDIID